MFISMAVVATKCLVYLYILFKSVSCMQTEGVGLCTEVGALSAVSGRAAFHPAGSAVQSVFLEHIYTQHFSLLNSLTAIQPLQILSCCAVVVLCVNAMH